MKNINSIWQVPKYLPYVQAELTDEILADAEKKLGHKLPKEYIDLLKIQNGGYIRFSYAELPSDQIYGIGPNFPNILDTDWSEYEDLSIELDGLVPFYSDGHCFMCFDYRKNKEQPQITYVDSEMDTEETIAGSFSEYLDKLVLDKADEYVIETDKPLEKSVEDISAILNIKFEARDVSDNGYPVYGGSYNDTWIWINHNKVPAALIREDEEGYEELKHLMEIQALQHPEVPENSVLVTLYEEVRNEVIEKLKAGDISVKPLSSYF